MNEPTVGDAMKILKGLKPYFEDYHRIRYTGDAIKAAVELSSKYINDRKLPDKAIDVIDVPDMFYSSYRAERIYNYTMYQRSRCDE